jgi:hypothetical protein
LTSRVHVAGVFGLKVCRFALMGAILRSYLAKKGTMVTPPLEIDLIGHF